MKRVRNLSQVFLLVLLAGCSGSAQAAPSSETIQRYIASRLPASLDLASLNYRTFNSKTREGAGRVSAKGRLKLTENRYVRTGDLLRRELSQHYMGRSAFRYFLHCGQCVYKPIMTAGQSIPFTFEGHFVQTVDGFRLRGDLRYDLAGYPRSQLHRETPIVGTPSFEAAVDKILSQRRRYVNREGDFIGRVQKYFDSEHCWYQDDDGIKLFTLRNFQGQSLNRSNEWFYYFQIAMKAKIHLLKKHHWFQSNFEPGDSTTALIIVNIKGPKWNTFVNGDDDFRVVMTLYLPNGDGGWDRISERFPFIDGQFVRLIWSTTPRGVLKCTKSASVAKATD